MCHTERLTIRAVTLTCSLAPQQPGHDGHQDKLECDANHLGHRVAGGEALQMKRVVYRVRYGYTAAAMIATTLSSH